MANNLGTSLTIVCAGVVGIFFALPLLGLIVICPALWLGAICFVIVAIQNR